MVVIMVMIIKHHDHGFDHIIFNIIKNANDDPADVIIKSFFPPPLHALRSHMALFVLQCALKQPPTKCTGLLTDYGYSLLL